MTAPSPSASSSRQWRRAPSPLGGEGRSSKARSWVGGAPGNESVDAVRAAPSSPHPRPLPTNDRAKLDRRVGGEKSCGGFSTSPRMASSPRQWQRAPSPLGGEGRSSKARSWVGGAPGNE